MAWLSTTTADSLKSLNQSAKNREQLQELVNETLFGVLDNTPSKSIVADIKTMRLISELEDTVDVQSELEKKKETIEKKIEYSKTPWATTKTTALNSITYNLSNIEDSKNTLQTIQNEKLNIEISINDIKDNISMLQEKIRTELGKRWSTPTSVTAWEREVKRLSQTKKEQEMDLQEISRATPLLEEYISLQKIYEPIKNILWNWSPASAGSRRAEFEDIKDIMKNTFKIWDASFVGSLGIEQINYEGNISTPIDLDAKFTPWLSSLGIKYDICDNTTWEVINQENNTHELVTDSWQKVRVKWIKIETTTVWGVRKNVLNIQNVAIDDLQWVKFPVNLSISIRWRVLHGLTWANIDHFKKLNITINEPNRNTDRRHTTLWLVENALTAEYIETRLRQDYENKFNKLQREVFESTLSSNPEFAKLNQAQKDRLYERMQDLGTIANGPVTVKLWQDAATPPADVNYDIADLTFWPTTHDYSVMPHAEDYNGFKVWLANQAPKDVLADPDKYREWIRNGLVASLDNGKTHYESFFADVLKQFTDNVNVKTTLNKTLLDFINDTNEADHVWFEADLAATLNATEPETTYTKKRYQKLAFWTRGEPQNYLSFFSGQSHEFKTESITAGWKTFSYSGKLDIHGAQSMSMSLKMKDGQEQFYQGGNPVSLVRTLLNSVDIEPPHARFHAGLSVVKSVTKLARDNGISLRTALTPEMLDTLPMSIRTTLENGENPMVEVVEENGKLVAKVFNLNLTTRRKENEYKMFDEQDFVATQSVRDLRQWVQSLLALTNQTMNNVYSQYREGRFRSWLRPGLLRKPRYGGLRNMYKKLSFDSESISVWGKSFTLTCKNGLFTFSGGDLKKPIEGRNLGDLLAYNPALRGVELKAMHVANEKMLAMYQDKLEKQERHFNYGVIDEENHRVYIYDKHGNLWYLETHDQEFESRRWQYSSGHRYGRIADEHMPTGFRVMKKWKNVVDTESYENFLRNETLVGSMVRSMSRTHRALMTWAPW